MEEEESTEYHVILLRIVVFSLFLWMVFGYTSLRLKESDAKNILSEIKINLQERTNLLPEFGILLKEKKISQQMSAVKDAYTQKLSSLDDSLLPSAIKKVNALGKKITLNESELFAAAQGSPIFSAKGSSEIYSKMTDLRGKTLLLMEEYDKKVEKINDELTHFPGNMFSEYMPFAEIFRKKISFLDLKEKDKDKGAEIRNK